MSEIWIINYSVIAALFMMGLTIILYHLNKDKVRYGWFDLLQDFIMVVFGGLLWWIAIIFFLIGFIFYDD